MGLAFSYLNESSSSHNSTQNIDLFQHLQIKHVDQQSQEVICPICAAMVNGEPNLVTADLISHIANDHQHQQVNTPSSAGEGTNSYSRQSLSARDYDFGVGVAIRGGFRRGSLRTPGRRGVLGRGGGPVSQHFVVDTSSGLSTVGGGGGNDPIADLLTQLSTVRRLAAANNNNSSLPPSSNTINLQTLTRQQYERERERLRAAGRSHHHHHHPSQHSQQSTATSDIASAVENDLFDSLFSSAPFIDPSSSSTDNHQTWTHIVAQQQSTPEQQSQTSSIIKNPSATSIEPDPSLLRRMCDESSSSSSTQQSATVVQPSKQKSDFVQCLLVSSFAYTVNDK